MGGNGQDNKAIIGWAYRLNSHYYRSLLYIPISSSINKQATIITSSLITFCDTLIFPHISFHLTLLLPSITLLISFHSILSLLFHCLYPFTGYFNGQFLVFFFPPISSTALIQFPLKSFEIIRLSIQYKHSL